MHLESVVVMPLYTVFMVSYMGSGLMPIIARMVFMQWVLMVYKVPTV